VSCREQKVEREICEGVVLIQVEQNTVVLTPFGSLVRMTPAKLSGAKSWTVKRGAVAYLALSLLRAGAALFRGSVGGHS
jgi:hypothetical protein